MKIARIKAPLHITINITGYCGLNCQYCYAQPFTGKAIEYNKIIDILEEAVHLGVFQIKIGGGEPLLHPDILQLIEYAIENSIPIAILSSLAVNKPGLINSLAKTIAQHRYINFQVSLDALDPKINDIVRGKGSLVKENIEIMLSHGVDLQLASVISKYNVNHALELINFYYPKIKRFHFMNLMPTQKLHETKMFSDLVPTNDDILEFWTEVSQKSADLPGDVLITHDEESKHTGSTQVLRYQGCSACVTSCEIDSNLNVIACNIARLFVVGNLTSKTLEEIWKSEEAKKIGEIPIPLCHPKLWESLLPNDLGEV